MLASTQMSLCMYIIYLSIYLYVSMYVCISSLTSQHVYIGAGTSHRIARSLNCDNFGQEQYFLMR